MLIARGMDDEDVVHIYTGILPSHKEERHESFAEMWMALGSVIQSGVNQKEKNKHLTLLLL